MRSFCEKRKFLSGKSIAVVIAMCALFVMIGAVSGVCYAKDATVYTEGALQYTIENDSITIVGYFGKDSTVTVPNQIAGIPVNTIAKGAFDNTAANKVKLPDTIVSIQEGAIGSSTTVVFNSNTDDPDVVKPEKPPADDNDKGSDDGDVQKSISKGTEISGKHEYVVTKGASGKTLKGAKLKDSKGRTYTVNDKDQIVDDETGEVVEALPAGSYSSIGSVESEEVEVDLDDMEMSDAEKESGSSKGKIIGIIVVVLILAAAGVAAGIIIKRRREY